ncbi:MAG: hypothetical protein ABSF09_00305 [Candidatus Bathyarchaeia archaeon]|jgi:hypothetical protein
MHRPGTDKEFNDLLVECIDETMTALFSREVAQALFLHLQKVHSTSKNEIPYQLEILVTALERMFGHRSSGVICKVIARKFYAKLNLRFDDHPERTFLDYVKEAKIKL